MSGVRVEGLAELRRDLRRAERTEDLRDLRDGLKDAADVVTAEAKQRANSFSFQAADVIRSVSGGNRAFVVGGKASLPWYGWADFGSRTPRRGQSRSTGPWANSGQGPRGGRFIYPAFDAKADEVARVVEEAIGEALRRLDLTP